MSQHLPARSDDIPASLVDVAETFGLQTVLTLVAKFGGREMKFPKEPADDHPVIEAFGEKHGRKVSDFLSGATVYIPHLRRRSLSETKSLIRKLEDEGLDRTEIAQRIGVSPRHVRRVANSAPFRDPNQLDMFSDD